MKIRTFFIVWGFASVVFLSGCKTMNVPTLGVGQIGFEPLNSSEYKILGDAEGEATVWHILGMPFGDTQVYGWLGNSWRSGWGEGLAYKAAMYKAIDSVPEADAIILPRSKGEANEFILFGVHKTTVKGKAIQILKN